MRPLLGLAANPYITASRARFARRCAYWPSSASDTTHSPTFAWV